MTHYLRFTVIQVVLIAAIVAAWLAGIAALPFQGSNAPLAAGLIAVFIFGLLMVLLRRWDAVDWISSRILRLGLLGTVIGLIIAFKAAEHGTSADIDATRAVIGHVIGGMYIAMYLTLIGVASSLWLDLNSRLLRE